MIFQVLNNKPTSEKKMHFYKHKNWLTETKNVGNDQEMT